MDAKPANSHSFIQSNFWSGFFQRLPRIMRHFDRNDVGMPELFKNNPNEGCVLRIIQIPAAC